MGMRASNIHISWDGPFMTEEQIKIRQWLSRALLANEFRVCSCHIGLLTVSRGDLPDSFIAELSCGCGALDQEKTNAPFLISFRCTTDPDRIAP
jgi:hypothetical protein